MSLLYNVGMCRGSGDPCGARRCRKTSQTRANERDASRRYYQRGVARRRIAELSDVGVPAISDLEMSSSYAVPSDSSGRYSDSANLADSSAGPWWSHPGVVNARDESGADGARVVEVRPEAGAVIVHVSDQVVADRLVRKYGASGGPGGPSLDWGAMRADGITAVHVPAGVDGSRFSAPAGPVTGWVTSEHVSTAERTAEASPDRRQGAGEPGGPEAPDMDSAWARVPKRFRPAEGGGRRTDVLSGVSPAAAPVPVEVPVSGGRGPGGDWWSLAFTGLRLFRRMRTSGGGKR